MAEASWSCGRPGALKDVPQEARTDTVSSGDQITPSFGFAVEPKSSYSSNRPASESSSRWTPARAFPSPTSGTRTSPKMALILRSCSGVTVSTGVTVEPRLSTCVLKLSRRNCRPTAACTGPAGRLKSGPLNNRLAEPARLRS